MEQPRLIRPGDAAKNFSLKDQRDETVDLFEMSGKRVILSFHPLAWTKYCAAQMISLEKNKKLFERMNTVAVGISVDSQLCKQAWAESLDITTTPLLSDFWPHGAVAQHYGIFREANGFSQRANIIIDEDCTVSWVKKYPVHSVPDIGEVISTLTELNKTKR